MQNDTGLFSPPDTSVCPRLSGHYPGARHRPDEDDRCRRPDHGTGGQAGDHVHCTAATTILTKR